MRFFCMAIYPKPRLSVAGPDHKVYPYLLKGVTITESDQAWCADITYIRLAHGFAYLVAILDWHSRYVLSWDLGAVDELGQVFLPGGIAAGAPSPRFSTPKDVAS